MNIINKLIYTYHKKQPDVFQLLREISIELHKINIFLYK